AWPFGQEPHGIAGRPSRRTQRVDRRSGGPASFERSGKKAICEDGEGSGCDGGGSISVHEGDRRARAKTRQAVFQYAELCDRARRVRRKERRRMGSPLE